MHRLSENRAFVGYSYTVLRGTLTPFAFRIFLSYLHFAMPFKRDRKFNHNVAFELFVLGVRQADIATRFNVSKPAVNQIAKRDDWKARRDAVLIERAKQVGPGMAAEQGIIRYEELRIAKELMAGAKIALRKIKWEKVGVNDLIRVMELSSKLGRLGAGLPLQPMELNVQVDLSGEMRDAIERVYGAKQPQLAESTTQPAAEAQVIDVEAVKDDKDIGNGI